MEEIRRRLDKELREESELAAYYLEAIELRMVHPELSEEIAREVFDRTHPSVLVFSIRDDVSQLRDEFGALEAPGLPDNGSDPDEYRDALWRRLKDFVDNIASSKNLPRS
jgi:hypothetical protein